MKKYRCLWCVSIPNHNILYFLRICSIRFLNTANCLWKARRGRARRGFSPSKCTESRAKAGVAQAAFGSGGSGIWDPAGCAANNFKPSPGGKRVQGAGLVQFEVRTVRVVDNRDESGVGGVDEWSWVLTDIDGRAADAKLVRCGHAGFEGAMQDLRDWKGALPPAPVALRGQYVTLEPLDAERHSAALWRAVEGHDELWAWLPEGPFAREPEFRTAVEKKQAATGFVFLAIVPQATGQAAGWASLMRPDPANGVIEVGFILYSPTLQRTREATEAMYLMMRHVFEDLGYRRYEWKCNALNEPSRRAALRLGYTFEGIFRQHMVVKGQSRDSAWYSMLDSEWPARKQAFEAWLAPENFDEAGRQRQNLP
jgi:RimJ/RimL family protein N-acetyltransferase